MFQHNYRPDIDGLRGIAVLLVVAFHLQMHLSHGGFIGVDIFFVISGFLITSVLVSGFDCAEYRLTPFYIRRVCRLTPALLVVLTATSIGACFVLWPSELVTYAQSLLSALFSGSNFWFWSHSSYFDAQSSSLPLLHTWSLAVEEQFYLAFPLFLAFIHRRFQKLLVPIIAVLAIASFALSARTALASPGFAFYWPFSRAWELLLGSILALRGLPGMTQPDRRNLAALLGVALIAFAALCYWSYTPFPGIAALAPCVGAALIIGAGTAGPTLPGKLLSWRPLVFTGLISYSLYLWHWPLVVFESMGRTPKFQSSYLQQAALIAVAFLLATLSWRFIERPFRAAVRSRPPAAVFGAAALAALIPAAAACAFLLFGGLPARFSLQAVRVASWLDSSDTASRYRTGSCFLTSDLTLASFNRDGCLHESPTHPNVLLFGDSHAAQLDYGLVRAFPELNFLQATAALCLPVDHHTQLGRRHARDCVQLTDYILNDYLPTARNISVVLLSGHWTRSDLDGLDSTIRHVQSLGIPVALIGPAIEYDAPLPRLLAFSLQDNDPTLAQRHQVAAVRTLDTTMATLARDRWHVPYFSWFDTLCPNGPCEEYAAPGIPLEQDEAHLTGPGSLAVARKIEETRFLALWTNTSLASATRNINDTSTTQIKSSVPGS